mmetsp:Transcript_20020/g.41868  ORF Transcript_20020/g.41868 Transcript_20020/m.41868 type:complete len:364 (-) Transcript_20020:117-1208(-)
MVSGDVEDGVANPAVLGLGGVEVVGHVVLLDGNVLEHGVLGNGAVDLGLSLLGEVDSLGVASSLEVEDSVVIPSVLVVSNESPLRVGAKGGLSGPREPKEEGGVAILSNVGGAMHWHDPVHGKPIVHEGEDSLLVLSPVPSTEDDSHLLLDVEGNSDLGVEVVLFPLLVGLGARVDDGEVDIAGNLVPDLRADEHVGYEVLLPSHLVHEPNLPPSSLVGAAVDIGDVELLLGVHVVYSGVVEVVEDLGSDGLVDVTPPHVLVTLTPNILHDPLILGTPTSELSSVDGEGVAILGLCDDAFAVGLLVFEELLKRKILVHGRGIVDTKVVKTDLLAGIRPGYGLGNIVIKSLGEFKSIGRVSCCN